ncbi:STAS/SEC14 domain-containing protein [Flagellimonas lutaonensis]|uniref:STAS/SEC14 domain-containing protein n=1 Tax=Flagellimonas lutaonensis TaxID=516051 RepID=A0A0D5YR15_9FLAO|nr:STAS/SEC14 domain-containing protein [Allomuricauda lutaonensis]AKA34291.1 hypothetical protein VC82_622 [Allomuricauda lutaonensis]
MFTIKRELPEDILGVAVSGKVTGADYDRLNPLMEQHKEKYGKIKLLVDIEEFKWPTAKAMWEDLKMGFRYLGTIKAMAVISDKDWIENVSESVGAIIPKLKVKGFETDERSEAIDWLKKF